MGEHDLAFAEFFCHRVFVYLAAGFAIFFGVYGFLMEWCQQPAWRGVPWSSRFFAVFRLLFQLWFNAVGGFAGWVAVWFLWGSRFEDYAWRHLVALIIAFSGITGNLPYLSTSIRDAISGLGKRMAGAGGGE
jgi:hypothetical protein